MTDDMAIVRIAELEARVSALNMEIVDYIVSLVNMTSQARNAREETQRIREEKVKEVDEATRQAMSNETTQRHAVEIGVLMRNASYAQYVADQEIQDKDRMLFERDAYIWVLEEFLIQENCGELLYSLQDLADWLAEENNGKKYHGY
jgi:hypothetical protein